jgi:hypothetical protein
MGGLCPSGLLGIAPIETMISSVRYCIPVYRSLNRGALGLPGFNSVSYLTLPEQLQSRSIIEWRQMCYRYHVPDGPSCPSRPVLSLGVSWTHTDGC